MYFLLERGPRVSRTVHTEPVGGGNFGWKDAQFLHTLHDCAPRIRPDCPGLPPCLQDLCFFGLIHLQFFLLETEVVQ